LEIEFDMDIKIHKNKEKRYKKKEKGYRKKKSQKIDPLLVNKLKKGIRINLYDDNSESHIKLPKNKFKKFRIKDKIGVC